MKNSSPIGDFLKNERKRLRLNQAEVAEKCGVSREIWGRYERGLTAPGGEVLHAFAQLGADMQYVFTGVRSSLSLTAMERLFLDKLRQSTSAQQDNALRALLGEAVAKQVFHGNVGQHIEGSATFEKGVTFDFNDKK